MQSLTNKIQAKYMKSQVVDVQSGDTVRVYQEIVEGTKKRVQMFEGMVIRVTRKGSLTNSVTVRKIASGVGVEKSFMLHAPSVIPKDDERWFHRMDEGFIVRVATDLGFALIDDREAT